MKPFGRIALLLLVAHAPAFAAEGPVNEFPGLKYRNIGPAVGGRVCRVAGVPGDPLTYYAAVAGGGVWKSEDGGLTFRPVFDDQPCSSVGSIAVAPSDPNVVYAGTGEANIRGNVAAGLGIFKSTDAGKTWKHVWKEVGHIGTMAVHPQNSDVAFAAVLGHAFGPNPERGVYRTTDGGKSWQRVLYQDNDTGASDVCIDPNNPRVVFAGLWQARRRPWELTSGGPSSGLYVSRDGGDTWEKLGPGKPAAEPGVENGLPAGPWGKVSVAVAPSQSNRVYALIEAAQGGLYRSDDGGAKWELASDDHALRQRIWYFGTLAVDPQNPDVVYAPQVRLLKSIDGGRTFKRLRGTHHGDHHDVWIDPKNPRRMIVADDGGVDVTGNGGATWYAPPLPVAQFYHVRADNGVPYRVMGCMQDLSSASGPTNSLCREGVLLSHWHTVGGGEAGFAVPDPFDPDVVYSGEYGGYITRYDERTRQARNVSVYPYNPSGHPAEDLKYRFQWTAPILVSAHDRALYHAANVVFRSRDGGQSWQPISPDLTRNDRRKQQWTGGPITGDNTGVEIYCTVFALAESPRQAGVLWAGSDDGLVHVSRDSGRNWENVTPGVPGLPDWGTVSCIEASAHDAGTAFLVVDAHRLDDYRPYLWKTTDFGRTWVPISAGLAPGAYLHAVREDPKKKGLLYVATERGVCYSPDSGSTWKPLQLNLPAVGVTDLVVKDDDLVLATNGRSLWVLDDLTLVRELGAAVLEEPAHLFTVRPAVRWRYHPSITSLQARGAAPNPPNGAVINYRLKERPKQPVTVEVRNARGERVALFGKEQRPEADRDDDDEDEGAPAETGDAPTRRPAPTGDPGVNRFVWDLLHKPADLIVGAKVDTGNPARGPSVAPGTYTVNLTVDGKVLSTTVDVLIDPRLPEAARAQPLRELAEALFPGGQPAPAPAAPAPERAWQEMKRRWAAEYRNAFAPGDRPAVGEPGPMPRLKGEAAPAGDRAPAGRLPVLLPPLGGPAGAAGVQAYEWLLMQRPGRWDARSLAAQLRESATRPAPASAASDFGAAAQEQLALRLRDDVSRVTHLVEQVRAVRKQLRLQTELLRDQPGVRKLLRQNRALREKLSHLEAELHNPRAKVTYDILAQKGGAKLYSQLVFLMESVAFGDGPPTQGVREMAAELEKELAGLAKEFDALRTEDIARLNELAKPLGAPTIWVPPPVKRPGTDTTPLSGVTGGMPNTPPMPRQ